MQTNVSMSTRPSIEKKTFEADDHFSTNTNKWENLLEIATVVVENVEDGRVVVRHVDETGQRLLDDGLKVELRVLEMRDDLAEDKREERWLAKWATNVVCGVACRRKAVGELAQDLLSTLPARRRLAARRRRHQMAHEFDKVVQALTRGTRGLVRAAQSLRPLQKEQLQLGAVILHVSVSVSVSAFFITPLFISLYSPVYKHYTQWSKCNNNNNKKNQNN